MDAAPAPRPKRSWRNPQPRSAFKDASHEAEPAPVDPKAEKKRREPFSPYAGEYDQAAYYYVGMTGAELNLCKFACDRLERNLGQQEKNWRRRYSDKAAMLREKQRLLRGAGQSLSTKEFVQLERMEREREQLKFNPAVLGKE